MIKQAARLRSRVLRVLGLASKRDLLALETRLDTLIGTSVRQTERLECADLDMAAAARETEQTRRHMLGTRGGELSRIERNVHALMRRQFVDETALPFPKRILAQRFHVNSQNEEDGITLALFNLVGTTNRRFLELGSGLNGGNTGFLAESCGWTGLMVDGKASNAARLAARFARYGVDTKAVWITRDNVNQVARDSPPGRRDRSAEHRPRRQRLLGVAGARCLHAAGGDSRVQPLVRRRAGGDGAV